MRSEFEEVSECDQTILVPEAHNSDDSELRLRPRLGSNNAPGFSKLQKAVITVHNNAKCN